MKPLLHADWRYRLKWLTVILLLANFPWRNCAAPLFPKWGSQPPVPEGYKVIRAQADAYAAYLFNHFIKPGNAPRQADERELEGWQTRVIKGYYEPYYQHIRDDSMAKAFAADQFRWDVGNALEQLREKDLTPRERRMRQQQAAIGRTFDPLWPIAGRMYLWLIPLALVCLLLRVTARATTLSDVLWVACHNMRDLFCWAFAWPLGLLVYNPEETLRKIGAYVAERDALEDPWGIRWARRTQEEIKHLSPRATFAYLYAIIWLARPATWQQRLRAVALTGMAGWLCLAMAAQAQADELAQKPSPFDVKGTFWEFPYTMGDKWPPGTYLTLMLQRGYIGFYDLQGGQPGYYELAAKFGQGKSGHFSWTSSLFGDITSTGEVNGLGLVGLLDWKDGHWSVSTPYQIKSDLHGGGTLVFPNFRAVRQSGKWDFGLGAGFFDQFGQSPDLVLGLTTGLTYDHGRKKSAIRIGPHVIGPNRGSLSIYGTLSASF